MRSKKFAKLLELSKEIQVLSSIERTLFWDQETMMPKAGIGIKTEQKKAIAKLIHAHKTSDEYESALFDLIDPENGKVSDTDLNDEQVSCLKIMREDLLKAKKIPSSFVEEFAQVTSESTHAWIQARKENDFKAFAPHLKKVLKLMREKTMLIGYEKHPYDALLDDYEAKMTTEHLDALFGPLKESLIEMRQEFSQTQHPNSFLFGTFDAEKQLAFGKEMLATMGLDPKGSRLDLSEHPFCMPIHPKDLRLTTHIEPSSVFQAFSATMHEGGHGLYEQGLDPDNFGLPTAESCSMGIHESQSKIWETCVGLSLPFFEGLMPKLSKTFTSLQGIHPEAFYKGVNNVKPSLIRIHADEVTYGLHVILRYEIEKALIEKNLEVEDLPEVWNGKMSELLGIVPHTNSEGCMQDIHWASGLFGYFPTYALGNLYAAQLFDKITSIAPDWQTRLRNHDFKFIREWLQEHVHKHGRRYTPKELIEKASGKPLSSQFFLSYLDTKYKSL